MTSVLKRATEACIPGDRNKITVKPSKSRIWNDRIENAVKSTKKVWWEWRKSGSPKDRDHPLNIQRREARKKHQGRTAQSSGTKEIGKIERIMNSSSGPKTFANKVK